MQGNVPVKTSQQRAKLRARPAVRRHGMSYAPKSKPVRK